MMLNFATMKELYFIEELPLWVSLCLATLPKIENKPCYFLQSLSIGPTSNSLENIIDFEPEQKKDSVSGQSGFKVLSNS